MFDSVEYAMEIYDYSVVIEKMKIVHSLLFFIISLFLIRTTAKYNTLSHRDYLVMLILTIGVTIGFLMPLLFIVYVSYQDVSTSYHSMNWNNQTQSYGTS